MSVVELRARGNATGSYVRPQGSDSYPPDVGVSVGWVLAQPVQDLLDQGRALKWRNLGTIGNLAHLQKHGDHTAHSAGKVRGIVYAKDTELPGGGADAVLWLCRQRDYDTSYIDFFNVDGAQYNYAGVKKRSSSDQHLHVSIRRGAELLRVTLFDDVAAVLAGTYGSAKGAPEAFHRLGFVDGAILVQQDGSRQVWLAGRGKRTLLENNTELTAVRQFLRQRGANDRITSVLTLTSVVV